MQDLKQDGFEGCLDRIDGTWVLGWAWHRERPDAPIEVELWLDGGVVGGGRAAGYRPDLQAAGKGDGRHAFQFELPAAFRDGRRHEVAVRFGGTEVHLGGSPKSLAFGAGSAQPAEKRAAPGTAPFRSRFGGLWADRADADAAIAAKAARGEITAAEVELLRRWRRDGYVILPQAVPHAVIDALDAEVEAIWAGTSAHRCFVEYFENGEMGIHPAGPAFVDKQNKLLDLYVHLEQARAAVFAPPIVRFLKLLFERPPLAFQGLYFRWGSRQAIHQDTAFVKVSSPLEFAASWIALEDIQPSSGELEYYVGSHELDDYLFEGRYKWMPLNSPEYQPFLDSLHARSEARGLKRERFRARKGDALIWAADLAHGGSADVRPGLTRKSLVTHYCPVDCEPVYGVSDAAGAGTPRARFGADAEYTSQRR